MKIFFQFCMLLMMIVSAIAQEDHQSEKQDLQLQNQISKDSSQIEILSKNGFFLGFEGNLGQMTLTSKTDYPKIGIITIFNATTKTSIFSFDGGLKLGYQHYFGEQKDWGLRLGGYAGMGTPISQKFRSNFVRITGHDAQHTQAPQQKKIPGYVLLSQSYLPLKLGIDLDVLWDFWKQGEHTLGLTLGMSYRLNYYQSIKNTKNYKIHIDDPKPERQTVELDIKLRSPIIHSIVPQIGLHYYLGHHQFELSYRFGGIISWEKNYKNRFSDSLKKMRLIDEDLPENTIFSRNEYISFAYLYRF